MLIVDVSLSLSLSLSLPLSLSQDVTGLKAEDPIYWEPGKLKMKIIHAESKQVLSVSLPAPLVGHVQF